MCKEILGSVPKKMQLAVSYVHFFVAMRLKRPILPRQTDGARDSFLNKSTTTKTYMPF
jgi:hypothetical protein